MRDVLSKITDLVINNTIKNHIPTVIVISNIEKEDLIKNFICKIRGCEYDETVFTPDDWIEVARLTQELAKIPVHIEKTEKVCDAENKISEFIKELDGNKGIVIINSGKIKCNFAKPENINITFV